MHPPHMGANADAADVAEAGTRLVRPLMSIYCLLPPSQPPLLSMTRQQ